MIEHELEKHRRRLKTRIDTAFRRNELLLEWEAPDSWGWLYGDERTRVKCRKVKTRTDLVQLMHERCPRMANGEPCVHADPAVALLKMGWGAVVFDIYGTLEDPLKVGPHWHRSHEKIVFVTGDGIMDIAGVQYEVSAQDIFDIPAGEIHSGIAFEPSRAISFFMTPNGAANYMGPLNQNADK